MCVCVYLVLSGRGGAGGGRGLTWPLTAKSSYLLCSDVFVGMATWFVWVLGA